jgi:O-methyltransferase
MQGPGDKSFREACKTALPQLVHLVRLGRLLLNQFKFPIAGAMLDWQGRVQSGPFKGMQHPRSGTGHYAELLGTYELSLAPVIERVIARRPQLIIDVGAAAGYYSMGFALRCPDAKVIALEADPMRRDLMGKYVRKNGLENRIDLRGLCTVEALEAMLAGTVGAFLLMDVEGAEAVLLQPDIPGIDQTELLVELHELFAPGVTQRLQGSFAKTHHVALIKQDDVKDQCPPSELKKALGLCGVSFWRRLTDEHREEPAVWMHLVPKRTFLASQVQGLVHGSTLADASLPGDGALPATDYRHGRNRSTRAVRNRLRWLVAQFEGNAAEGPRAEGPWSG